MVPDSVTLSRDASQSGLAGFCGVVTVVVAVDEEGGFDTSRLERIQDCVCVTVAVWTVIKGESDSLQSAEQVSACRAR